MNDKDLEASWVGKTPEEYYGYRETVAFDCDYCGQYIYEGQGYYDFNGTIICEDCLIDYCNKYKKIAEAEVEYDEE